MAHGAGTSAGVCIFKNHFKVKSVALIVTPMGLVIEFSKVMCVSVNIYFLNQQKGTNKLTNQVKEHMLNLLSRYSNSFCGFQCCFGRWSPKTRDKSDLH